MAQSTQARRRTPHSGKQKKVQLQAERRRRAADPDEEEAAAASEAQEAVVREYHVDARGYRWKRSAEGAVLVGMVVQRARGGGVVVRLSMCPVATGSVAAAAAAGPVDPVQARIRRCQSELSSLARFKPSQVGGQRWTHESSRWAAMAHRVAAIAAEPRTAAALSAVAVASTELFLLQQHALQSGPLAGATPANFKPFAAACRRETQARAEDGALHPYAAAAAAVLDGAAAAEAAGAAFSSKQLDTLAAWRKAFATHFHFEQTKRTASGPELELPPS